MTKRNLYSVVTLMSTFKLMTNVAMVLLFATTILTSSCSGENVNYHASSASNLIGSMTEDSGLGWAEVDVEANATDANGNALSAAASVRYEAKKEVMVENEEELGLPVSLTLTGENTIATGDGNTITRTENHSASKGVTLNVAGPDLSKGGTLGERTENGDTIRQEVLANLIDEAFATAASLPEGFTKEWRGAKTSTVRYYRVYVKPTPVETLYRLRVEFIENDGNNSYWRAIGEISTDGGASWTEAERIDEFCAITCGSLNPQISGAKLVTSFSFTPSEDVKELEQGAPRLNEGNARSMEIRNTVAKDCIWSDDFAAPADADGNTMLRIGGAQAVRVYEPVWHSPAGEIRCSTPFKGEVVTTVNKVDEATGVLTITREVRLNGERVNSETATVQLELAN